MKINCTISNEDYIADLNSLCSLAIVMQPHGENLNCYYAEDPVNETIRVGAFVGSVAEGGSVNYTRLSVTPHGNGTHTECYGHISPDSSVTLDKCLQTYFFTAQIVSVTPIKQENGDYVVSLQQLQELVPDVKTKALIIRTLPNNEAKKTKLYSGTNPPYFAAAVGHWLASEGVEHVLLDLPSVDREQDEGRLVVHRGFWQYPDNIRKNATITELIFVPDTVVDGLYLLNLQVPRWATDAAPSQPVVYPLHKS